MLFFIRSIEISMKSLDNIYMVYIKNIQQFIKIPIQQFKFQILNIIKQNHQIENMQTEKSTKIKQSNPIEVLQKKCQLLKEKIMANTQISHNIQQYRISQLQSQQLFLKSHIKENIQEIKESIESKSKAYRNFITKLNQQIYNRKNVQENQYQANTILMGVNPDILTLDSIKKYLNTQKKTLKQVIDCYSSGQAADLSSKLIKSKLQLHKMEKRKKLQRLMEQIRKKQLIREIKYLDDQVCAIKPTTWHNKNQPQKKRQIIYIPDECMTDKQQEQYNNKIQLLLGQAERLTELETICPQQKVSQTDKKHESNTQNSLKALNNQKVRLLKTDELISSDLEKMQKLNEYVESFDKFLTSMPGLASKEYSKNHMIHANNISFRKTNYNEQMDMILQNLSFPIENQMSSRICSEQQLSKVIKGLKNRSKRLGI